GKFQIDIGQTQYIINIRPRLPVLRNTARLAVVLKGRVIAHPLAFDVLDKLTVPGAAYFASLLPVEHKFRDGILDKCTTDIGVFDQDFKGIPAWAPLAVHGHLEIPAEEIGFAVTLLTSQAGLVFTPLVQHVFQKFGAPGMTDLAPLTPVSNKFRNLLTGK